MVLAHTAWEPAPAVLAAALVAVALFSQGFVRLRRRTRRDHAPWTRAALFALAVSLGTLALVSPLDSIGEDDLLSAHMLQHVVIGDLVPALAIVALRGPLLFFAFPIARLRRTIGIVTRPWVAFGFWAASLGLWHTPFLYEAALRQPLVHDLEHASFFLGGILVWTQLVDPARRGTLRTAGRIGLVVAMLAGGQMLASVLVFSYRPLYGPYSGAYGLSALGDQQAAALVMSVEQLLTLGTFVALTLRAGLRRPDPLEPVAAGSDRHPVAL